MLVLSQIQSGNSKAALIDTMVAAASDVLPALGWELRQLDKTGRGYAMFDDGSDRQLVLEIGYWYPPGAHHLDDQPAIVLSYQEKGAPKVQIPYQGQDRAPDLHWSSTADEISRQTRAVIGDFEKSFLARCPDRQVLYNRLLDHGLRTQGLLSQALVQAIKEALAQDQATSVTWAESKLAILKGRLRDGGSVMAYDPVAKRLRKITTTDQFDAYAASSFGLLHRNG
jgi:hypothetical protein